VNVAAQHDDRRGRLASEAAADIPEEIGELLERTTEGRPVLEVDRAANSLAKARGNGPPPSAADRLTPRLEVMNAGRRERGQCRRDDQVVERASRMLGDPLPFVCVDHVAPPVCEHTRCTRVDHEQP